MNHHPCKCSIRAKTEGITAAEVGDLAHQASIISDLARILVDDESFQMAKTPVCAIAEVIREKASLLWAFLAEEERRRIDEEKAVKP